VTTATPDADLMRLFWAFAPVESAQAAIKSRADRKRRNFMMSV
jgi:hypothetical protein